LAAFDKAAEAWRRALAALPTEKLSPAEKKQRDQYSSELAVAKAKLEVIEANSTQSEGLTIIRSWEKQKLPWERAIAILPDLAASLTWSSSVGLRLHTSLDVTINTLLWPCAGMGDREGIQSKSVAVCPRVSIPFPKLRVST
jgi:hypothetical protein